MKTLQHYHTLGLLLCICIALLTPAAFRVTVKAASESSTLADASVLVYVGTYTGAKSKGIYAYRMDPAAGSLTSIGLVAETANPTFLALHPNQRFLYAANEISKLNGQPVGGVSAYSIDPQSGKLTFINQQSSGGSGPCHLIVDNTGKCVLVANYGGGSVSVLPILDNGRLGASTAFVQHQGSSINQQRQAGPHAHGIYVDSANRYAFVADLGLDKVLIYRFDASKGTLAASDPPSASVKPGAGPRHFAFHPSGRFAYVINELDSTVTAFAYEAKNGILKTIQSITTLPADFSGRNYPAEIEVHPSGRFLYGSNRGHDSIAVFAIDNKTGMLNPVEYQPTQGKNPRNFGIDPAGHYLLAANQGSDSIVVFRIDSQTGKLTPSGQTVELAAPVCVKFVPVK
jgi:6-phosphogluconolactonase